MVLIEVGRSLLAKKISTMASQEEAGNSTAQLHERIDDAGVPTRREQLRGLQACCRQCGDERSKRHMPRVAETKTGAEEAEGDEALQRVVTDVGPKIDWRKR